MLHRIPAQHDFSFDTERLANSLGAQGYTKALNPYPWGLSESALHELHVLGETVQRAVSALVPAWYRDWRIRRMVSVSDAVEALLQPLASLPYRTGALRPDFVMDVDGVPRISEINARFPLNGFLISHLLNQVQTEPLAPMGRFPDLLEERLLRSNRIGIVKGREAGWDILLLKASLGERARIVPPGDLCQDERGWRDSHGTLDVLVLEVHQDEILATPALHRPQAPHFNDLRTIFIAHDKRLLSVLSSDVVLDYVTDEDAQRLHRHVIPTWSWGLAGDAFQALRQDRAHWVIKPATLGKGEGIVMGRHCSGEQWTATLRGTRPDSILQPYIEQRLFDITTATGTAPMRVVGTLPLLDEHVLGPGIFRASQADIVNVVGGGTVLCPALLQEAVLGC